MVGPINRLMRQTGGVVPDIHIQTLNDVLAVERPRVAARVRKPYAPLYVRERGLRLAFLVDPALLRRAASVALEAYCSEAPDIEHKAFRPLDELGELTLGPVRTALAAGVHRQAGFPSEADLREFCDDPNGYLEDVGAAIVPPESLAFGPMQVAVSHPPAHQQQAWQGSR